MIQIHPPTATMQHNLYDLASEDSSLHGETETISAGPCPNYPARCRCDEDGFQVFLNANGGTGGFSCRGCWDPNHPPLRPEKPRKGNYVDYYMHFRGMPYPQARAEQEAFLKRPVHTRNARPTPPRPSVAGRRPLAGLPPDEGWQASRGDYVQRAVRQLWNGNTPVMGYLAERGFRGETIRRFQFGAINSAQVNERYLGDIHEKTWFVVIPYYIGGQLWQVEMRDIWSICKPHYRDWPKGGNGLYNADVLQRQLPTFLVESAFCAAILVQETPDLADHINVVATGSTDGAKCSKWVQALCCMPVVWLAQDNDRPGNDAACEWARFLSHRFPTRRAPFIAKDINDMKRAGYNVHDWALSTLSSYRDAEKHGSVLLCCAVCGASAEEDDGFSYDDNGTPLCSAHYVAYLEMSSVMPEQEEPTSLPRVVVEGGACIGVDEGIRVVSTGKPFQCTVEQITTRLVAQTRIALDLETTGIDAYRDKVISIALGVPDVCEAVLDMRAYYQLSEAEKATWRQALASLFARSEVTWIGHNLKFDWAFLAVHFGVRIKHVYDTMLAEQVVRGLPLGGRDADRSVSLLHTADRYKISVSKEERSWYVGLDKRPEAWYAPFPGEQLDYMCQDIAVPYQLVALQGDLIQQHGLSAVVALENEALPAIAAMEVQGVLVDVPGWQDALQELVVQEVQLEREIKATLAPTLQACFDGPPIAQIQLSSASQITRALASLGVTVSSTKAEALEALVGKHPVVSKLLRWKELNKASSTFGESFLKRVGPDGRVHANFGQIGAETGRMTCSKPNLQQIPKDGAWRQCIIAPPGHKLVKADLSNIELRILAELSGDPTMLRFFAEGKDLHAETAKLMFKLPPETNTKKHLYQGSVSVRDIAKAINFGLAYGMGAQGLALRVGTDVEEARKLMETYAATYPAATKWLRKMATGATRQGYSTTVAGRKRLYPKTDDKKVLASIERQAKNHPIQGSNADIIKRALARLGETLPPEAHIILVVHDEIVLECPDEQVGAVSALLTEQMVAACREFLHVVAIPEPDVAIDTYWRKE